MNTIYLFWSEFNWLEFVTYILIPTSITLVLLVYLYYNIQLLKLSFDFEMSFLEKFDKNVKDQHNKVQKLLDKYCEENCKGDK